MTTHDALLDPRFLPRILYVFKEPFDKERAMVDWKYGGDAKLTNEMLIYFYEVVYSQVFLMLDTIFTPYISKPAKFIKPHPVNIDDFRVILHSLYSIQEHNKFGKLYVVDFSPFDPIDGDYQRLLADWAKMRNQYIDHYAKIKNLVRFKTPFPLPMPYRLEKYIQVVKNNLQKYKSVQGYNEEDLPISTFPADFKWDEKDNRIYHFGDMGDLTFNSKRSTKQSVFRLVIDRRGQPVRVKEISKKFEISEHNTRQVVRDINKTIRKQLKGIEFRLDGKANVQVVISSPNTSTNTA